MEKKIFYYDGENVNIRVMLTNANSTCEFYTIMVFATSDEGYNDHVATVEHGFNGYTRAEIIGRMFYLAEQYFPFLEWYYFGEPEWFNEWQQLTIGLINCPE